MKWTSSQPVNVAQQGVRVVSMSLPDNVGWTGIIHPAACMSTATLLSERQGVDKLARRSAESTTLHQMGVFRQIEGIDPSTLLKQLHTELFRFASARGMRDKDVVRQRCHKAISVLGQCRRSSPVLRSERGEYEHAVFLYRSTPFHREAHPFDAAGRA
jgi:hypothetical protein